MKLPGGPELERRVQDLLAAWRVADTAVRVRWNPRLTTTAGRAFLKKGAIELNPALLERAPDQLPMILAHEAAHIAACRLFGPNIPPHGRHWRSLMRLAGHEPQVTHDIPIRRGRRPGLAAARSAHVYLRVCDACGDRRLGDAVRYGRCHGCGERDRFLVLRARAGERGRAALERLSLAEVRERCIMGGP